MNSKLKKTHSIKGKGCIFLREIRILRSMSIIGLGSLPFLFKKQPVKDWVLVFFIKGFYSGFIDSFVVSKKKVTYPVRAFPKVFDIHIIFDLLLFPIACVLYNQMTYRSSIEKIISKVFIFSIPISMVEYWAEKNTRLIKYHKGWNIFYSSLTLTISFLLVRATMGLIRKYDKTTIERYKAKGVI